MFFSHQIENLKTDLWKPESLQLDPELAFWITMAERYGRTVLELGTGTGRIAEALSKAGCSVTGMEASSTLIWEARKRGQRHEPMADWVQGDIRKFNLGRRYELVLMPHNAISHFLDEHSLEDCLASVRSHLAEGGRFIVDAFCPTLDWLTREDGVKRPVLEYQDQNWKGRVAISQSRNFNRIHRTSTVRTFFRFPGRDEELIEEAESRLYFQGELSSMLQNHGFTVEAEYSDYGLATPQLDSPRQLLVCSPY